MVVGFHVLNKSVRAQTGRDYEGLWGNLLNGHLGVSVFFVISGFLITHLLIREKHKTGRIHLGNFYIRRTFRIWPAFFFYLSVVLLLHYFGAFGIARRELIGAATFTYNYIPHTGNPRVSASWSLSVEEQFYLLWPLAFLFTSRRRNVVALAIIIIALVPTIRFLETTFLSRSNVLVDRMWQMTHTRADTLMFGCLIALLWDWRPFQRVMNASFKWKLHWLCLAFVMTEPVIVNPLSHYKITTTVAYSIEAECVSVLLVWLVIHDKSLIGRLFNSRIIVHLGMLSYGVYLWNPAFCTPMNTTWSGNFPLNVIFTLVVAELSLRVIETPFLHIRDHIFFRGHRVAQSTSPNRLFAVAAGA